MQTIRLITALLVAAFAVAGCDAQAVEQQKRVEFVTANEQFVVNEFARLAGERATALARQELLIAVPKGRSTGLIDVDEGTLFVTFKDDEQDRIAAEGEKILAVRTQEWKDAQPGPAGHRHRELLRNRGQDDQHLPRRAGQPPKVPVVDRRCLMLIR